MFCDQCGAALASGQQYCSRCGKVIVGKIETYRRTRVQEHIRLVGILWLAYSAFNAIGGVVLVVLANTLFRHVMSREQALWLHPFLTFIGGLVILKAVAGFFAGWGLLQREPWGRMVALVMGFIALFTNIPLGTALGIYTLWVLLPSQSDDEYRVLA